MLKQWKLSLAAITAAVLVAGGCGGSSDDDAQKSADAAAAVAEAATEKVTELQAQLDQQERQAAARAQADRARAKAARANDDNYPSEVRNNFLSSCVASGGSNSACACALEKIEAKVSVDEFAQIEANYSAGGKLPRELTDPIVECR